MNAEDGAVQGTAHQDSRARPFAAHGAHVRLRAAAPGIRKQAAGARHRVRAPGGAEAGRAVRRRRRLPPVPAARIPGVQDLQRRHAAAFVPRAARDDQLRRQGGQGHRDAPRDAARGRRGRGQADGRADRRAAAPDVQGRGQRFADADDDLRVHDRQHRLLDLRAAQRARRPAARQDAAPDPVRSRLLGSREHAVRASGARHHDQVGDRPRLSRAVQAPGADRSVRRELQRQEGPDQGAARQHPGPRPNVARRRQVLHRQILLVDQDAERREARLRGLQGNGVDVGSQIGDCRLAIGD